VSLIKPPYVKVLYYNNPAIYYVESTSQHKLAVLLGQQEATMEIRQH